MGEAPIGQKQGVELLRGYGLGDTGVHPRGQASSLDLWTGVCRGCEDQRPCASRLLFSEAARDLRAIHAGDIPVEEHNAEGGRNEQGEGFLAVGSELNLKAQVPEHPPEGARIVANVLDDEDPASAPGHGCTRRGFGGSLQGKPQEKGGYLARCRRIPHGAAHPLGQGPAHGESKARPGYCGGAGSLQAGEAQEKVLLLLHRDTDAVVDHHVDDLAALGARR